MKTAERTCNVPQQSRSTFQASEGLKTCSHAAMAVTVPCQGISFTHALRSPPPHKQRLPHTRTHPPDPHTHVQAALRTQVNTLEQIHVHVTACLSQPSACLVRGNVQLLDDQGHVLRGELDGSKGAVPAESTPTPTLTPTAVPS